MVLTLRRASFHFCFLAFYRFLAADTSCFYNVFDAAQVYLTSHISNTFSDAFHNHFIPLFRILSCLLLEDILNSAINKALSFIL